ncbi:MAG: hypothetical protein FJY83_08975 [Candidatus Aminicenantes bacterium]|nr:hypothetical protein [Candidatus Aminicenantes bacterium]
MSNNREVRELQFTRMQLVVVFILVIALGAFIFVLGVSVGKKQARLAAGLGPDSPPVTETVKPRVKAPASLQAEKAVPPAGEKEKTSAVKKEASAPSDIQKEIASFQAREKTTPDSKTPLKSKSADTAPPAVKKPLPAQTADAAATPPAGLFYIQVVAATQKADALRTAEAVRKLGFAVYVLEPQATDRPAFYRVRVGGYRTEQERSLAAERLAASLNKKTGDFYYPPRQP